MNRHSHSHKGGSRSGSSTHALPSVMQAFCPSLRSGRRGIALTLLSPHSGLPPPPPRFLPLGYSNLTQYKKKYRTLSVSVPSVRICTFSLPFPVALSVPKNLYLQSFACRTLFPFCTKNLSLQSFACGRMPSVQKEKISLQ